MSPFLTDEVSPELSPELSPSPSSSQGKTYSPRTADHCRPIMGQTLAFRKAKGMTLELVRQFNFKQ